MFIILYLIMVHRLLFLSCHVHDMCFQLLYNSSWWSTLSLKTNFYCMWALFHIHTSLEFVYININVYTIVICLALLDICTTWRFSIYCIALYKYNHFYIYSFFMWKQVFEVWLQHERLTLVFICFLVQFGVNAP